MARLGLTCAAWALAFATALSAGPTARANAPAQGKILGLVTIPKIIDTSYPDGPPESKMNTSFTPVKVYAKPDAQSSVVLELRRQNQVATNEYAYEKNAALVFEKKAGWYRIGLAPSGLTVGIQAESGWVEANSTGSFIEFTQLLEKSPYMTTDWNNFIYKNAGSSSERHPYSSAFSESGIQSKADVNVLDHRLIDGELWVQIQVLGNGRCVGLKPKEVDRGWVPAFNKEGLAQIWYNPRGCPGR